MIIFKFHVRCFSLIYLNWMCSLFLFYFTYFFNDNWMLIIWIFIRKSIIKNLFCIESVLSIRNSQTDSMIFLLSEGLACIAYCASFGKEIKIKNLDFQIFVRQNDCSVLLVLMIQSIQDHSNCACHCSKIMIYLQ